MPLRNTAENYGLIAKTIHWTVAFLFLGSYITVYYRRWFTEKGTPENFEVIQLHFAIGMSIAALVLLRIIWRITNRKPDMEPGTKLEHLAAKIGHYALYAAMIVMPLTGYMGTGANTDFFGLFEIPKFELTTVYDVVVSGWLGMDFQQFEKPIDYIHKNIMGKWLVWILIVGHAAAAWYHHLVKKDRTLKKMTTG